MGGAAGKLLAGFRGAAPADVDAVVDLVIRVAQLADDILELAELDLNPVIAHGNDRGQVESRLRPVFIRFSRPIGDKPQVSLR
jgi:ATP-grasp domain